MFLGIVPIMEIRANNKNFFVPPTGALVQVDNCIKYP